MQNKQNVKMTIKPPAKPVCMTYTDDENKMIKMYYGENGYDSMEIVQLAPDDERNHISCIMEYEDGTLITTTIDESGQANVHVNKPVIYNVKTGELEIKKEN